MSPLAGPQEKKEPAAGVFEGSGNELSQNAIVKEFVETSSFPGIVSRLQADLIHPQELTPSSIMVRTSAVASRVTCRRASRYALRARPRPRGHTCRPATWPRPREIW